MQVDASFPSRTIRSEVIMPYGLPFEEAYAKVIEHAAEGVDVDSVYRNIGLDPEFADDASKLAVALVIANSGCIQGKVLPSEVDYTIKLACKNLIERGHLANTSPEAAAESMSKMRSMI